MKHSTIRIESIEINNFKNVKYGCLKFNNTKKQYDSSILGLYGQNGSGKTALIDALELLKLALSGNPVPIKFADYIHVDSKVASFRYEFKICNLDEESEYSAVYEFCLRSDIDDSEHNTDQPNRNVKHRATIFNEVLSFSYKNGERKNKLSPMIDTKTPGDVAFVPKTKYEILVGKDKEVQTNLLVIKQLTMATSRSFVFSREFLNKIRQNCKEKYYLFLIESLVNFGNFELFIINTANSGLISMDALPLAFNYVENDKTAAGNILIQLNGPSLIPEDAFTVVQKVIDSMNIVLQQLVPGLKINVKDLGRQLFSDGKQGCLIQFVSNKNSKEIPFQYESEGIKKLVSILQLLIVVYNRASITVAIDEMDSGIFEYLLGELLRILSEKGQGQLIFTSHNLRPLETLDKGCVAFTTTNPNNRYIRLSNVKATNNLRDIYYRDIILGEQNEVIYEPTNNSEIALAFREADIQNVK